MTDQDRFGKTKTALTKHLAHEDRRSLWASLVPILPAFAIVYFVGTPGDRLAQSMLYLLVYWTLWCTCQSLATYLVFGRCDSETFEERIDSSRPVKHAAWRMLLGLDERAVSMGIQLSLAMAAVTMFVFVTPSLNSDRVIIGLAACSVISSWVLTAFTYTIDYARCDQREKGLQFPGEQQLGFSDYLYYAVCVSATFATSDVTVVSRAMRRLTTTHTLVSFGFNTIIFALLITLLTGTRP